MQLLTIHFVYCHYRSIPEPVNVCKNRSSVLPLEGSRVHLTPKPGEDGSDYINATWLQGMYCCLHRARPFRMLYSWKLIPFSFFRFRQVFGGCETSS